MDGHTKTIIATLFLPSFMIGTDFTGVMMLAIPIEREFSVDITTVQWVTNIYALTLAMALVAGGRLGDMFGHRRMLQAGLVVFLLASLGCMAAPTIGWLIGARAVQGIGTAIAWPCVLGMAANAVRDDQRGVVVGLILGAIGIGNVVAPLIAGILGGLGDWRMFFFINLAMAAISVLAVWRFLEKDTSPRLDETIDYAGMAIMSLAMLALLYGLDVGADWGWGTLPVIGIFAASVALFIAFPFAERRVADPMVPAPMMRNEHFLMALATNGLIMPTIFLMFLYMPQYIHKVLGWSLFSASMGLLPILISLTIVNLTAGQLYNTLGPRRLLSAGHGLVALGIVWFATLSTGWGYAGVVPPMLLIGIGAGLTFGPAGTAAVNAADASCAGLAGGLSYMFHLGFGAVGLAIGTAVLFSVSLARLASGFAKDDVAVSLADQRTLNTGSASGEAVRAVMEKYRPEASEKIRTVMADAFASGLEYAFWVSLVFTLAGLVLSLRIDDEKLHRVEG